MNNKLILVSILSFLVLGYLVQTILPWYSMAFLALILGFGLRLNPIKSLILYFLLGAFLWVLIAYWNDSQTQSQLSGRIGILFGVKKFIFIIDRDGYYWRAHQRAWCLVWKFICKIFKGIKSSVCRSILHFIQILLHR